MQRLASFLVCLSLAIPCAAGDNIRLAFNQQCLHRTPLLKENDNQSVVNNTVGEGRLFGIFINTTLYWQITESIDTYIADLESDGWQVVLYTVEGGTSDKSDPNTWTTDDYICELEAAEQLRELLKNEYKQGMVGCILIGELPAGWVETQTGSGIGGPVDLFFRDMDGHWEDCDNNGLLDENVSTVADCKPEICNIEIWMSRLYANSLDGDEVTLMKNYFRKNHAYRIGELTLPKRALDYVDDTWACSGFNVRGIYDDITQVNDNQITLASDYIERLKEGYDLIRVSVHGNGPAHSFYNIPNFATAYAHCYVHSPIAQDVRLRLGSDDGIKVWLNGENVHTSDVCRDYILDQDIVDVVLNEGWNGLLVKLSENCWDWRFSVRFTDTQGGDVENLDYQLNNPEVYGHEAPFIRSWLINGFYPDPNTPWWDRLSNDHLGGESDVNAVEGHINGDYAWEKIDSHTPCIDLDSAYSGSGIVDLGVSYAFVRVYSPAPQTVELWFGSDDGIKIWLNGDLVGTVNEVQGNWLSDQGRIEVTLQSGWNRLLIKVSQWFGGYGFSARLAYPDGTAITGLEYDPALEPAQYLKNWLINGYYKNPDKQTCLSSIDYLDGESLATPSEGEIQGSEKWRSYHSSSNYIGLHSFFHVPSETVSYKDVLVIDPCCFFYDSFSCYTFYWWLPNYIDGWYVFSPSYGLASWGECWGVKAGTFYNSLFEGKCLGEAQLAYLNKYISVDFGMFGDPTLAPGRPRIWSPAYVDTNAVGDNNGTSWENAYTCLQDALAEASWSTEIHVARGTYWPDDGAAVNPGARTATFRLKNGVAIRGGYAGFKEPDPNVRDTNSYETILSGDIGILDVNSDNSYHVVTAGRVGTAALLGGLTISGGYADGTDANGGGIYIDQAHPRLIDCNIISNVAADWGGGIYNNRGNPLLTQCTFSDNSSSLYGGGIYNRNASPLISHTKFVRNLASYGGGIYNYGHSGEPILSLCEFHDNQATVSGGAMSNYSATSVLTNCIFSRNQARWYGGGIRELDSASRLTNCTFSSNSAGWGGGAVYSCRNSKPKLTNCILWDDTPDEISVDHGDALPLVTYSDVQTSDQLPWAGEGNICANPCFAEVNSPDPNDWDYHLKSQAGRWDPNSQDWIPDGVTSPCVDAGNPGCSLVDEPNDPGNIRINMGAYGGTAEASKSPAGWRSIADLTNDFEVDFRDLEAFAHYWLDNIQCAPSDLNRNGFVDFTDLAVFAEDWLQ